MRESSVIDQQVCEGGEVGQREVEIRAKVEVCKLWEGGRGTDDRERGSKGNGSLGSGDVRGGLKTYFFRIVITKFEVG